MAHLKHSTLSPNHLYRYLFRYLSRTYPLLLTLYTFAKRGDFIYSLPSNQSVHCDNVPSREPKRHGSLATAT